MAVYPVKNKVYQTVLDVVKYALFDVPFDMERVDDWPEVYAEMKRQTIVSRRIRNFLSRGYGAKDMAALLQSQGDKNWAAAKKNKAAHSFAWLYQGCTYLKRALVEEKDVRGLLLAFSKGKQRKALMRTLGIQKEK